MLPKFETSIATNSSAAGTVVQPAYASFIAPAVEALGGEIAVAVLANSTNGDPSVALATVDSIRQYFLSNPTEEVQNAIGEAFQYANTALYSMPASEAPASEAPASGDERVGASAAIAVIANDRLFVGNVGNNSVYQLREDRIKLLASGRNWLNEAQRAWNVEAGEIHDHTAEPGDLLGQKQTVTPEIAPVDFIWPGDTLLLCTADLASRVRAHQIRDALLRNAPEPAAKELIALGGDDSAPGSLAAVVVHVAQPKRGPVAAPMAKPARPGGISPIVKALALLNLLLLCGIALALARGGSSLLAVAPTIEVAKPMFVQTETASASPTPGLAVDPLARTPVPAGAPTLAPTATPMPTYTPVGSLANWVAPPPPALQLPAEGTRFTGPDATVILAWDSVGTLPEDVFYVATIRKWTDGAYVGESQNWTKSTRLRLDSSFYLAMNGETGKSGMAAPARATGTSQFEWFVTLYRLTQIRPDGTLVGTPLTPPTPSRHFIWGPALATPVYGGDNVPGDPFFADMQQRTQAASNALAPISAGIAGLSLLFLLLGLVRSRPRF